MSPETNIPNNTAVETAQDGAAAFSQALEQLAISVPEIKHHQAEILAKGTNLLEKYNIRPDFFEDRNRAIIFNSLAFISPDNSTDAVLAEDIEVTRQREFVADALTMLTRNYSNVAADAIKKAETNGFKNPEATTDVRLMNIYDKYTDHELSRELTEKIEQMGIFHEVSDQLGIPRGSATPVEMRVLNFDNSYAGLYFEAQANNLEEQEMRQWEWGLGQKQQDFANEHPEGRLAAYAAGFFAQVDGRHYIFIKMASAEVLLAQERGIHLTDEGRKKQTRIAGTLKHEYVHTQKPDIVEGELGRSIEEQRAELFSGNTGEYFDVKRFFNHLAFLSGGKHINHMLKAETDARRNDAELSVYEQIASTYGLDMVAKITLAYPATYAHHTNNPFMKNIMNSLGGFDDIVKDYALRLTPEQIQDTKNRISHYLQNGPVDKEFAIAYLKPVIEATGYRP